MSGDVVSGSGLFTKLRVLLPYFAGTRWAFALAALGAAFAAVCETGVAWLLVPLVDGGMKAIPIKFLADLPHPPLWAIPVALVVLFALRGAAGFVVDYTLAWAANAATLRLRSYTRRPDSRDHWLMAPVRTFSRYTQVKACR